MMEELSPIITKNNHRDIIYNNSNDNQKWNHQGAAITTDLQECTSATDGCSTYLQNTTSNDNKTSFGTKWNLSSSLEAAKLSSHKYYHYRRRSNNHNNNRRPPQPQLLKQQKKSKKKAFYIANDTDNDDTDNEDAIVDQHYFNNHHFSTATTITSDPYENYFSLTERDYNSNSCCSSSDEDYVDPLPTPTNTDITTNITNTSSITSFTSSIIAPSLSYIETTTHEDKQDLSLITRFVPASIGSNMNNKQTVSSTSTVNHNSLYPSSSLPRCDIKCYTGLDEWFAARLQG